jgi:hypothetical protein
MLRGLITSTALATALMTSSSLAAAQPAQATPADAAPFLGDWTLSLQGPNGPGAFELSIKADKEKVVAEIANANMPTQAITDIAKADKTLVLRYTFTYEGNPVDAAVSLTPGEEGKVNAQIDFAGGAYVMTGTAAKKEKKQ